MTHSLIKDSKIFKSIYEKRMDEYKNSEHQDVMFTTDCGITEDEIQEFINFLNSGKPFTMNDLRSKVLYLANKYEFSMDSFWEYIMYRTGKWIKPKNRSKI